MKIIGFVNYNGGCEAVLKGDSCMLNGRKPLFVPDWTQEPVMTPCMILRVSRLGKEISTRFADRYYDAVAPGADFAAADLLRDAQTQGKPWTQALAFDYSLALGEWLSKEEVKRDGVADEWRDVVWLLTPEEAIAAASKIMTIRQGDLIYIQAKQAAEPIAREQIIRATKQGQEKLYCKIK